MMVTLMDYIIQKGPFMGFENNGATTTGVAAGLGLGVNPGLGLYKELLEKYDTLRFKNEDGTLNKKTIVAYTTEVLQENGLLSSNDIQNVGDVWIYPADYFNPLDSLTGKLKITNNTRSIHWYMNSWSDRSRLKRYLSHLSHRLLGMKLNRVRNAIHKRIR